MRRRQLMLGLVALSGHCVGHRAIAQRAAPSALTLTASDVHPSNYPTVQAVRWIGEQLRERSGGRIGLRLYHSGQLGRESDAIDMVRFGVLDLTRVYAGALNNAFPLTAALCLPYVFDSVSHLRRAIDGAVGAQVLADFERRGLVGLAIYDSGARCFYNARRPVRVPQDLRGMKLRIPPSDMFLRLLRDFGANPTPLAYGAVYSALETRLIDGAENNIRSFHSSRHFEAARYWSQSEHSYAPDMLLIARKRLDSLSAHDQQLLRQLGRDSVAVMRALWDEGEAAARAAIEAGGVEMAPVDMNAFRAASKGLLDAYRRDPRIDQLYRMIRTEASA
jgi:tripartite ATP-independent transporter DctP family solute receptor